jgi:acyl carrier protein
VFLARIDAEDQLLGYVLHHIVSDGWSMPILAREFSELYRAAAEGRPAQLAPQPIQPSDVYRWQHDRLSNAAVQHRLDDWRAELAGLPPLRLPLDRPRPAVASAAGRKAELELPADLVARADELARSTGRIPFAVLLAAFAVLLQQRSGQYDLAIGSVFSGRVRTEMESLIGYFANTGVLRIRTAADQPLDQLIGHCHEVLLDAQRMQDIPFPDVVNAIAPARTPGTNPLFQVCFTLARGGVTLAPLVIDGVDVQLIEVAPRGSRFDLTCQLTELLDGSYAMKLEYATELFDESSVLRLAADYRSLLRALLTDPAGAAVTVSGLQQAAALGADTLPDTEQFSSQPVEAPVGKPGSADGESLRDAVARLWAEVFEVTESFTDDQNFFEVGGNSLTAVRLRARIVSEFGVDIPLADIFAGGSVAELLPYLEAGLTGPVGAPALDTQ